MKRADSLLFAPYRQVGVVCSPVRPVVRHLNQGRKMYSLLCAVDNVVIHYRADRLRTVAVSDALGLPITALAGDGRYVYAASGNEIALLPFCRQVERRIKIGAPTRHLLVFGEQLVAVDFSNNIHIVDIESGTRSLLLEWPAAAFEITALIHPATYINKILLGASDGRMRILNIRTGKVVFEFASGCDKKSSVTVLEQSPALDVVAVGYESGKIELRHLKKNETVMSFRHEHTVTAIGFRSDGESLMTSADSTGVLAVWNLEREQLVGRIADVHSDSVTMLHFIEGEAIMLSASADNSLRVWVLDQPDGMPRQLVILEGHSKPVQTALFIDKHEVVSAGLDESVRKYSVISDTLRQKLGSAGIMSRSKAKAKGRSLSSIALPPVVEMAYGWTREASWDNVLCRHADEAIVTTWTTRKQAQGTHNLLHERFTTDSNLRGATARSIALSPCGNSAYIGYSSGHLDMFNVQSARFIRSFLAPKSDRAHEGPITVLTVDSRGHELISASASGRVRFWSCKDGTLASAIKAPGGIARATACPVNALVAVVTEKRAGDVLLSACVHLIDTLCRRVVRTFKQPERAKPAAALGITSVAFSADGKWILIADTEGYIRVWDIATASLIDVLAFSEPCIAMAFNPSGEFLATCHKDQRAVFVWASKNHFAAPVPTRPLPLDYLPKWEMDVENLEDSMEIELNEDDDKIRKAEKKIAAKVEEEHSTMLRLSGLNPSRWANLPDLDHIRQRNKPIDPVKKPKRAPFFLSAAATLGGFEFEKEVDNTEERRKIAKAKRAALELESEFSSKLRRASTTAEFLDAFSNLKKMTLSAIDFQIRTLTPDVVPSFLRMLLAALKTRGDFDLVQAYLATVIKIHRTTLWTTDDDEGVEADEEDEVSAVLKEIAVEQEKLWQEVDDLFAETSAVIAFAKTALV